MASNVSEIFRHQEAGFTITTNLTYDLLNIPNTTLLPPYHHTYIDCSHVYYLQAHIFVLRPQ